MKDQQARYDIERLENYKNIDEKYHEQLQNITNAKFTDIYTKLSALMEHLSLEFVNVPNHLEIRKVK